MSTAPTLVTLDELIVVTMVSQGRTEPAETVERLRQFRAFVARAAELRDLTLHDDLPAETAMEIVYDALDLKRLDS